MPALPGIMRSGDRRYHGTFVGRNGCAEGVHRYVTEGIGAEEAADFFGGIGGGDELFFCGRIDAVVARGNSGWATDADVDFFGTGFADHANDFAGGGTADDGVVDENDALTFDEAAHGVELELDAEIADSLRRFDEGAADVVIADEA